MFGVNADHMGEVQNLIPSVISVRGILVEYGSVTFADGSMNIHLVSAASVHSPSNTDATGISSMGSVPTGPLNTLQTVFKS